MWGQEDHLGVKVLKEEEDQEDQMVSQENKVYKVPRVKKEIKGNEGLPVSLVRLGAPEREAFKGSQVYKDRLGVQETGGLQENQDREDCREMLDLLEKWVLRDLQVLRENLVYKASQVQREMLDLQAVLELLGSQGSGVNQEPLGKKVCKGKMD